MGDVQAAFNCAQNLNDLCHSLVPVNDRDTMKVAGNHTMFISMPLLHAARKSVRAMEKIPVQLQSYRYCLRVETSLTVYGQLQPLRRDTFTWSLRLKGVTLGLATASVRSIEHILQVQVSSCPSQCVHCHWQWQVERAGSLRLLPVLALAVYGAASSSNLHRPDSGPGGARAQAGPAAGAQLPVAASASLRHWQTRHCHRDWQCHWQWQSVPLAVADASASASASASG